MCKFCNTNIQGNDDNARENNKTILTRKRYYLPLRYAGRRIFLSSSLNIPQHPLTQLAIILFPGDHDILPSQRFSVDFVVVLWRNLMSYAWHMTGDGIPITHRAVQAFKNKTLTKLMKSCRRSKRMLKIVI